MPREGVASRLHLVHEALASLNARERAARRPSRELGSLRAELRVIEARLAYVRSHPGVLPAE